MSLEKVFIYHKPEEKINEYSLNYTTIGIDEKPVQFSPEDLLGGDGPLEAVQGPRLKIFLKNTTVKLEDAKVEDYETEALEKIKNNSDHLKVARKEISSLHILKACDQIASRTRRGPGNCITMSQNTFVKLEGNDSPSFNFEELKDTVDVNLDERLDDDLILCSYKGQDADGAIFLIDNGNKAGAFYLGETLGWSDFYLLIEVV